MVSQLSFLARKLAVMAVALAFTLTLLPAASMAAPYKLSSGDEITLRVVEWQPDQAKYASWAAVDGNYTVNASGEVSVPIAGEVPVVGHSTDDAGKSIAAALAKSAGLSAKPYVSVEVRQYGPIFVAGEVAKPGRYIYEPGMTLLQAVSLAGGIRRADENANGAYFERDRIQAAGDFRTALTTQRHLLLRRARLQAEIAGQDTFSVPKDLVGKPGIKDDYAQELDLMRMRSVELQSRRASTDDLIALYGKQIETLQAKEKSQEHQVELAQQELKAVSGLREKGLASNSREFGLERSLADAQSQLLDLQVALTQAQQSLSESKRDRADIINTRNAKNEQELSDIELALRKTAVDMQVAKLLGEQAGYRADAFDAMQFGSLEGRGRPQFEILRQGNGTRPETISADEATLLRPHDVVKVTFGLPAAPAGKRQSMNGGAGENEYALSTSLAGNQLTHGANTSATVAPTATDSP